MRKSYLVAGVADGKGRPSRGRNVGDKGTKECSRGKNVTIEQVPTIINRDSGVRERAAYGRTARSAKVPA